MTPLPVTPAVVLLLNEQGNPTKIASNIAPVPEMQVEVARSEQEFEEKAKGKPFNQTLQ